MFETLKKNLNLFKMFLSVFKWSNPWERKLCQQVIGCFDQLFCAFRCHLSSFLSHFSVSFWTFAEKSRIRMYITYTPASPSSLFFNIVCFAADRANVLLFSLAFPIELAERPIVRVFFAFWSFGFLFSDIKLDKKYIFIPFVHWPNQKLTNLVCWHRKFLFI